MCTARLGFCNQWDFGHRSTTKTRSFRAKRNETEQGTGGGLDVVLGGCRCGRLFVRWTTGIHLVIFVIFFSYHFYFPAQLVGGFTLSDLVDKPWSQASSLLPPGTCPHFNRA